MFAPPTSPDQYLIKTSSRPERNPATTRRLLLALLCAGALGACSKPVPQMDPIRAVKTIRLLPQTAQAS